MIHRLKKTEKTSVCFVLFITCAQAAEVLTGLGTCLREKLDDDSPRCRKENQEEKKITEINATFADIEEQLSYKADLESYLAHY